MCNDGTSQTSASGCSARGGIARFVPSEIGGAPHGGVKFMVPPSENLETGPPRGHVFVFFDKRTTNLNPPCVVPPISNGPTRCPSNLPALRGDGTCAARSVVDRQCTQTSSPGTPGSKMARLQVINMVMRGPRIYTKPC